ncbi:MAG TPA: hypothetical protein VJZ00_02620, partial [Thermoanaerobaculia bacterium]|nr:hypothetical protein [Thermoanaerobaculia bacterium]
YFAGHWVEITSATGVVKGTWRIANVPANSTTVTLAPNGSETISLEVGDKWQGVYLFDKVSATGAKLISVDPIRAAALDVTGTNNELQYALAAQTATIRGTVNAVGLTSTDVTVDTAGVLRQYGSSLTINTQKLTVLGAIDVTSQGYGANTTYPGAARSTDFNGGAHIGHGGFHSGEWGSTFGSVYRPQEAGGGGGSCCGVGGTSGGGVIRVVANDIVVNGAIRANSSDLSGTTGGGGSIWITTAKISGTGSITANSGRDTNCCNFGSGGGGALALEYTDPTSVLPTLQAMSQTGNRQGGPGIYYVKGATSTYGDATIDNGGKNGQPADLPSLGRGRAQAGTSGATIVTDLTSIPPYFAGHWVDVFTSGGARKGTWRIASITGKNFTLAPNANETLDFVVGDTWRGVYLFDKLTLRNATVRLLDDIRSARDLDSSSSLTINDPPSLAMGLIQLQSGTGTDAVVGVAGAVTDLHPPINVVVTNKRTGTNYTTAAASDGSFNVPVGGELGDTFSIRASDSYTLPATSFSYDVTGSIVNFNGVTEVTLQPSTTVGGATVTGSVRMKYPVARASAGTVTLSSSSSSAVVPASVVVPTGASSVAFQITTTSVASDTNVTIGAASNGTTASTALKLLAGNSSLAQITLTPQVVQGGTSINANLVLGAPAPVGGASVSLTTSDARLATVPGIVVVPEGATSTTFTVTTSSVPADSSITITGNYGGVASATATLSACTSMATPPSPGAISLAAMWVDDSVPAGSTQSGDAVIDSTQFASGSMAVHLSGSAAGTRTFAFTGAAAFAVTPADKLVLYALINPCNPPKQLLVRWKGGSTEYRASWGESRIEPTVAHTLVGSMPAGGAWVKLEVPARTIGITANVSLTEMSIRTVDGEAWI